MELFWGVPTRVKNRPRKKLFLDRPVVLNEMRKLATLATKNFQFLNAKLQTYRGLTVGLYD